MLRIARIAFLFLTHLVLHFASKWLLGRSSWPSRFLGAVGRAVGARATVIGAPVRPHTLLVANHLSWLDILVLGGVTGCVFVSKDNLGHPFVHWLSDLNQTIYIRRSRRGGARDQAIAIAEALGRPRAVALFPEGTIGPGGRLLPFRSTLLESAALASENVVIRPAAIDYGAAATEIAWDEESAKQNVVRMLNRRGSLPMTVRLLAPLPAGLDRKALARASQDAIADALSASSPAPAGL